ncbi:hypothetical protein HMPREF1548_02183 [Clostridium sp. KLE 1755]|nr:hypothetical protein HMPREF1548_02183 [Clostridium sp. KLE 1755]
MYPDFFRNFRCPVGIHCSASLRYYLSITGTVWCYNGGFPGGAENLMQQTRRIRFSLPSQFMFS